MFSSLSLAKRIYLVLAMIAILLLISTIISVYVDQKDLSEDLVERNLESLALNYFDGVNTMMLTGTTANRKLIQDKLLSQDDITEAVIIRAPGLINAFGKGFEDQSPSSDIDNKGLAGERILEIVEQDDRRLMSLVIPIRASDDYRGTNCLSCHQVKNDTVLGAVKMTYDLGSVDGAIMRSISKVALLQLAITLIGFGLISFTINTLVFKRLKRLRGTINEVEENLDLSKEITVHRSDELGAVSMALNKMMLKFRESFISVSSATEQLMVAAKDVDEISNLTNAAVLKNKNGTDSVAAAINELDTSASEVQNNTRVASEKSESASQNASQSLKLVDQAKVGINQLRDKVNDNTTMIAALNDKTNEVASALEVITSIAEQTNLLALNAAIEAARAGEQGRGFAVVADEVRSLATRTRESIDQIQETINALQTDAIAAVSSMNEVSIQANEKAEDVSNVANLLVEITTQIKELDELNCQIASSAEQQNLAADEINLNVVDISNVAEESSKDASRGKEISEHLLALSYKLNQQVSKFKL